MYDDIENPEAQDHEDGFDRREFQSNIKGMIDDCESYISEQSSIRQRSLEYYNGEMSDLPSDEGRSSVVSKDLRETVKDLMPSIMRTLFSNDKIVTYQPVGGENEQQSKINEDQAEQATDYVNHKVVPECDAEDAITDAIIDALLVKTGVIKVSAYTEKFRKKYSYTGQSADVVQSLYSDPRNEIMDLATSPEVDPDILMFDPDAVLYDFTLKRTEETVKPCMEAIQRDRFLIYPSSQSIKNSPIVGEKEYVTRSELVERGYDRDRIDEASEVLNDDIMSDRYSREGEDYSYDMHGTRSKSEQIILVYTVYVKYDLDDDGVSELYKVVMLEDGGKGSDNDCILDIEEVDEIPYYTIKIEREAYQFEGRSLSEDINDIQRVNTSLLRSVLDNTYWQNNQQPVIDVESIDEKSLDAVFNPHFGKPIMTRAGRGNGISFLNVPFIADKVFPIMEKMNDMKKNRTGVSDQSGGLNPETIRNMSATSADIINQGSIAQAEMMIRTIARGGLRDAFSALLRLVIQHTDRSQSVKIKGKWTNYDPRVWNSEMSCIINVGLGAGSKERDLAVMMQILSLQEKLFAAFGQDNPFVKPDQVYNVLEKITEAAGLSSASPYFTNPDPDEIQAKMQAAQNAPSDLDKKLQADMQMEKYKADRQTDIEQAQLIADREVERAQMEADIAVEEVRAQNRSDLENQKITSDIIMHQDKMDLEYAKIGRGTTQ